MYGKLLAKLLKKAPGNIKFSDELTGTKEELLRVAKQFELEGLIAKKNQILCTSLVDAAAPGLKSN
jgi:hypothetical protein